MNGLVEQRGKSDGSNWTIKFYVIFQNTPELISSPHTSGSSGARYEDFGYNITTEKFDMRPSIYPHWFAIGY